MVDLARDRLVLHQRPQLGREAEDAVALGVEERLLADPIAADHELPPPLVPDREREHAVQRADELRAFFLVEVGDHLGVALGHEAMAAPLEAGAQLGVVVDLAVEDHRDRAILVVDRLIARREVDHPQALDAEPDARRDVHASSVRTAMLECGAHAAPSTRGSPARRSREPGRRSRTSAAAVIGMLTHIRAINAASGRRTCARRPSTDVRIAMFLRGGRSASPHHVEVDREMETAITILQDLWRCRRLVAVFGLVAVLIGIFVAYQPGVPPQSRARHVGEGHLQILVDTPASQVVEVETEGSSSLGSRASLIANLMVAGEVKQAIARSAKLPPQQLIAISEAAAVPSTPPPAHVKDPRAYVLKTSVVSNEDGVQLPIIAVDTQAPDANRAAALANAAAAGLKEYLDARATVTRRTRRQAAAGEEPRRGAGARRGEGSGHAPRGLRRDLHLRHPVRHAAPGDQDVRAPSGTCSGGTRPRRTGMPRRRATSPQPAAAVLRRPPRGAARADHTPARAGRSPRPGAMSSCPVARRGRWVTPGCRRHRTRPSRSRRRALGLGAGRFRPGAAGSSASARVWRPGRRARRAGRASLSAPSSARCLAEGPIAA